MATTIQWYGHYWDMVTKGLALQYADISVRLVTSGYVFDPAHTLWDNGADNATDPSHNEVSDGDGYTAGGQLLENMVKTDDVITYGDVVWEGLDKTFRGVVGVYEGEFDGKTDPLLFYLLPDSTPADIVSIGSPYMIRWHPTDGLFYRPDFTVSPPP